MAAGRPTKYKPEYCQEIIEFFNVPRVHFDNNTGKSVAAEIPFLTAFARKIDVDIDTLEEWCKKHAEFSGAYKRAKEMQKEFLIANGLAGYYNPTFAIFTAKNITDMRDVVDQRSSGTINYIVTQVKKEKNAGTQDYK